jgi:tRNA 2-selenouridine synthase
LDSGEVLVCINLQHERAVSNELVVEAPGGRCGSGRYDFSDRRLIVLRGLTGVGKTDVLRAIAALGGQILDLEALACHRGSAFGGIGAPRQPTHADFQLYIEDAWRASSTTRPLFCEEEGDYLGSVGIPRGLVDATCQSQWIELRAPVSTRVARLVAEFAGASNQDLLLAVRALRRLPAAERSEIEESIRSGNRGHAAKHLLRYYDCAYTHRRARARRSALFTLEAARPAELAETILTRVVRVHYTQQ